MCIRDRAYAARFPDHEFAEIGSILHTLAFMQRDRNPAQAEANARQAVAMHRRLHGSDHPETGWGLRTLGVVLVSQNRLPEAEKALREAYEIFGRNFKPNHAAVRQCMEYLIRVLQLQGKSEDCEVLLRENLALQRKVLGDEVPDVAKARQVLGQCLMDQGRLEEAGALLAESAERLGSLKFEVEGGARFRIWLQLSQVLHAQGNPEGAREELRAAVQLIDEMNPADFGNNDFYECILLCVGLNALDSYQVVARKIVWQVESSQMETIPNLAYWACALGPDALTNYTPLLEAVSRVIAGQSNDPVALSDLRRILGALLYRAGRYVEAIEPLTQAYDSGEPLNQQRTLMWRAYSAYFLAMTRAQQGFTNEANQWLQRAISSDASAEEVGGMPVAGFSRFRRLTADLLRREAETVLSGKLGAAPALLDPTNAVAPR